MAKDTIHEYECYVDHKNQCARKKSRIRDDKEEEEFKALVKKFSNDLECIEYPKPLRYKYHDDFENYENPFPVIKKVYEEGKVAHVEEIDLLESKYLFSEILIGQYDRHHENLDFNEFKNNFPAKPKEIPNKPFPDLPAEVIKDPILSEKITFLDYLLFWRRLYIGIKKTRAQRIYNEEIKVFENETSIIKKRIEQIEKYNLGVKQFNQDRDLYWDIKKRSILGLSEHKYKAWKINNSVFGEYKKIVNLFKDYDGRSDESSIKNWWKLFQNYLDLPASLPTRHEVFIEEELVIFNLAMPDFAKVHIVKSKDLKDSTKIVDANKSERRDYLRKLFYLYPIRLGWEFANSKFKDNFHSIVVNSVVFRSDPVSGHPRKDIVASVLFPLEEIESINIENINPKSTFEYYKGNVGGEPEDFIGVIPVVVFDEDSKRFVEGKRIIDHSIGNNLAAMDWESFEHFIRELFEKEFSNNGTEVHVTRASKDKGVDAVVLDPDPIRGGKFIVQAKRYTNTVDLSAVRDLYGTVVNEGANRGILVTTSNYGKDAYDFSKGKPITLLNGNNLLNLLEKHGYKYFIDLKEAKKLLYE